MSIFLPKPNTDDQTGGPKTEWESVEHISTTQRKDIIAFETYISKLSERLKKIDIDTSNSERKYFLMEERVDKIGKTVEKTEKTSDKIINLVFFGFFALVFVVLGIGYGYWQFIFTASKNEDYKYGLSEKINNNQNEIKNLKFCLGNNKWLNPKCFEN